MYHSTQLFYKACPESSYSEMSGFWCTFESAGGLHSTKDITVCQSMWIWHFPSLPPFWVLPGATEQQGQHLPCSQFSLSSEVCTGESTEGFCAEFQVVLMLLGCLSSARVTTGSRVGTVCVPGGCTWALLPHHCRAFQAEGSFLVVKKLLFIGSWMGLQTLHVKYLSNLCDKRCCAAYIDLILLP